MTSRRYGGSNATARPVDRPDCSPRNSTSGSGNCAATCHRRSSTPCSSRPRTASPTASERPAFAAVFRGYLNRVVGLYKRLWINAWRKILSSRVLMLDGWVAFDLPRSVTVLGEALLLGLAGVHVYILMTASALPGS